jgi:hypothetical protein
MGNGKNIQLMKYCQQVKTIVFSVIDRNGIKWLGTNRDGVIGFDDNGTILKNHCWTRYGNLPISDVRSVAIDTKTNFG